ncbi:hypothetical protein B0T20DRAFT_463406 [Sordaria brevicollis]|uniref:Uncharacterized protein n=1 Tax=Sordaria brevicollis TaxID=83679 RepID=A0AAE0P9L9_SORBR|nr:hypothetical protein B0T20DRAFT_463406 [Sordaria brevicollis]
MGVAAPRNPNRQVVSSRQVSDTLPTLRSRQTQPSETSYTFSVIETAATIKTTPPVSTTRLLTLEASTHLSSFVSPATSSPSNSSAVALGIVFGVFFGTIIFSFILWRLCRRRSPSKSSASAWPSSNKEAAIMPVRYSSTMRYPQRRTPVRIKSSNRGDRSVPSSEAEKGHSTVKMVKVIQPDVPPPMSQRPSHQVQVSRKGHRRDNSTPRLHPGRQAVVDVSSPTADTWGDKDVHRHERSRHHHNPIDRSSTRDRNHQEHNLPPVIYVAGRATHERSSRRSRERDPQEQPPTQSRSRIRRSQPSILDFIILIVIIILVKFIRGKKKLDTHTLTVAVTKSSKSGSSQIYSAVRGGAVFG